MTCKHLTFGSSNYVERAELASVPESVTDINGLKLEHRARRGKWMDFTSGTVEIDVQFADIGQVAYVSLLGLAVGPSATVKVYLYNDREKITQAYESPTITPVELIPLGKWRAGIDQWGGSGEPVETYTLWLDEPVIALAATVVITHGMVADTTVYNDIPTQDEFGVISLEAEDGELTAVGDRQWSILPDVDASGGNCLHKSGGGFYSNALEGPRFAFTATATQTGSHNVWVRAKATGDDSFHTTFDGASTTFQHVPTDGLWNWVNAASATLIDGTDHTLTISAREDNISIDKIVILPNADPAPVGVGPAASAYGVVGSNESVQLRMLLIGDVLELERNYSWGSPLSLMSAPTTAEEYGWKKRPDKSA